MGAASAWPEVAGDAAERAVAAAVWFLAAGRATDPGSVADFQAFCRTTGNELVEHEEDGGVYRFILRKAA